MFSFREVRIVTLGCCREASSWNTPPQLCGAAWTAACATPFSLTCRDAQSEEQKQTKAIFNLFYNGFPHSCANCSDTHHLDVVKDSRDLLYSFDHFLWIFGVFSLSRHLLVKSHLPAHRWILHLDPHQTKNNNAVKVWLLVLKFNLKGDPLCFLEQVRMSFSNCDRPLVAHHMVLHVNNHLSCCELKLLHTVSLAKDYV